jgi:DEP domain-containing protein 5
MENLMFSAQVPAGSVTATTKATYRSLSAKVTIFIQVCRELWEFSGDGERYNEKIVHSFLPALFARWRDAGTNHIVTIVLVSRVYYDQDELDYAAGPLRMDDNGRWYKDFYKVITDLEVITDWRPTLVRLKDAFWAFQRDILLTHHYHRAALALGAGGDAAAAAEDGGARLVGTLSFAHEGPILEAINLALNPMEDHFVDRALSLTGCATIVVTPGTGYYRVSKRLLRLTTMRLLDQGFGVDLVSLTKPPLHQTPIFSFSGVEPDLLRADRPGSMWGNRGTDPLWGGDDRPDDGREKVEHWWEPFWMGVSFWDRQMDLPFRPDR